MNTQTQEALKMAIDLLEALEFHDDLIHYDAYRIDQCFDLDKTIQACKEALAQPAQEPVACSGKYGCKCDKHYTHPASSWQGLSDDDAIMKLAEYHGVDSLYETGVLDFFHAIEQALKEKNT